MPGKQEAFSEEENRVLRAGARKLKEDEDLTQAELGEILGIKQQNAGRLVGPRAGVGFGRVTANRLARHLGFRDAEHYLLEHGALESMKPSPTGKPWGDRDSAVRIARSLGFEEAAITAVVARFKAHEFTGRDVKWWMGKIVDEHRDVIAQRVEAALHAPPEVPAPAPRRKKSS